MKSEFNAEFCFKDGFNESNSDSFDHLYNLYTYSLCKTKVGFFLRFRNIFYVSMLERMDWVLPETIVFNYLEGLNLP